MVIDNTMRSLNKIHMILPVLVVGLPVVLILLVAPMVFPLQCLSYVVNAAAITVRCLPRVYSVMAVVALRLLGLVMLWYQWTTTKHDKGRNKRQVSLFLSLGMLGHLWPLTRSLHGPNDDWKRPLMSTSPTHQCLWKLTEFAAMVHLRKGCPQGRVIGSTGLMQVLLVHLAWIWVVVYVQMNADTAHDILLGRAAAT